MKIVRSKLRQLVDAKSEELGFKISGTQIAQAVGIRHPTIYAWLSDKPLATIHVQTMFSLMNYFDCENIEDILAIEEVAEEDEEVSEYRVAV